TRLGWIRLTLPRGARRQAAYHPAWERALSPSSTLVYTGLRRAPTDVGRISAPKTPTATGLYASPPTAEPTAARMASWSATRVTATTMSSESLSGEFISSRTPVSKALGLAAAPRSTGLVRLAAAGSP